jgi:TRAP-type transport system periplasmic protein
MRKLASILTAALVVGAVQVAMAANWDMPTPYPDGNMHTQNIKQFAEDVSEATGGELTITVHSNGSLFKHPEIKRAVQTGQVPIGEVLISLLSNEDPVFGVDSVPFLATSYEEARRLWEASRPVLEEKLAEDGLMLLYAMPWPPQGLYAKKEINSVADMRGVKFRAYNAATSRLAELMRAVPTQVEVPEIPQAFSTGLVDAMVTSPSTGVDSQAWDFLSHYYDTRAWLPKNMVIVNRRAFQRLDEATQEALLQAAEAAEERGWELSQEETDKLIQTLAENGIKVAEPSETLRQELAEIGETMTEEWRRQAGEDGERILEAYQD